MDKSNQISQYIDEVVENLNAQNPGLIDDKKIAQAKAMFSSSEKPFEEVKEEIDSLAGRMVGERERGIEEAHYDLTDFFDCRVSHDTLHLHVVPKSVKEEMARLGKRAYFAYAEKELGEALELIPSILEAKENKNVKSVFAVSKLLRLPLAQDMFIRKGFTVEEATDPYFREMFHTDRLVQARMSREKFLERYGDGEKFAERSKKEVEVAGLISAKNESLSKANDMSFEKPKSLVKSNSNGGFSSLSSLLITLGLIISTLVIIIKIIAG